MNLRILLLLPLVAACTDAPEPSALPRTASAEGASVFIVSPADSAMVAAGDVHVVFGIKGMEVAPAGDESPNTGHHHLLVDVTEPPPMDLPIPADSSHIHLGLGQTETTLTLGPGTHTLQLLLGDRLHIPHDPPVMSEIVTVIVE